MPDDYALQPVAGDPFSGVDATGAPMMPMPTQDQASRFGAALAQTWPAKLAQGAWSGFTLPGDAYQGKVDLNSDEGMGRVLDLAGLAVGAPVAASVERGAGEAVLGSGAIRPAASAEGMLASEPASITAYHGSPHSFDQFDISKIGTGEGAQAYGHGLYFAGNEGVARSYRDALSAAPGHGPEGLATRFQQEARKAPLRPDEPPLTEDEVNQIALRKFDDWHQQISQQNSVDTPEAKATWSSARDLLQSGWRQPPGSMYQVQINADPEHFLDWDKPLSEQSPKVQEAIGNLPSRLVRNATEDYGSFTGRAPASLTKTGSGSPQAWTGQTMHQALANASSGGDMGAALALRDAGIPGIKYLDAGSRSAGDGTHNYVIFSDDRIKMLRKYGLAGLGIGTGAGAGLAHFQMQPAAGDPYASQ